LFTSTYYQEAGSSYPLERLANFGSSLKSLVYDENDVVKSDYLEDMLCSNDLKKEALAAFLAPSNGSDDVIKLECDVTQLKSEDS
jgi:hypothetical protein